MANLVKSYFLAPQWHHKPGGAITLGSIVVDPKAPHVSYTKDSSVQLPALSVDHKTAPFQITLENSTKKQTGLSADILSALGVGGSIALNLSKSKSITISAREVQTQEIHPTYAYGDAMIQQGDVQRYLEGKRFKKDVYMVVGLKIAKNATIGTYTERGHGGDINVQANALVFTGVPIGGGPMFNASSKHSASAFAGLSEPFILAYRVRRITFIKKKMRVRDMDEWAKGAVLDRDEAPEPEETVTVARFMRLDDDELQSQEIGAETLGATDEGSGDTFELLL